jgi:hypothetical protein
MHLMSRIDHKHVLCCIGTSLPGVTPDRKFIALSLISVTLYDSLPPPPLPDGTSTIQRVSALKRWPLSRALKLGLEVRSRLPHGNEPPSSCARCANAARCAHPIVALALRDR